MAINTFPPSIDNAQTANKATNIASGATNEIVYQSNANITSFISAPTVNDTYLKWTSSGYTWASAGGGSGTVTSVSGTGSVNGITLTGTVTSSGSLTLGGTLSGIGNSQLTNSSITINGTAVSLGGTISVGTVTSVSGTAPIASSGGATPAISIPKATGSVDGYLSSTDWTTFNGKQAAYTNLTSIGSLANGAGWLYNNGTGTFSYSTPTAADVGAVPTTRTISTTAPLAGGGALSSNLTLSMPAATSTQNGYLTSTDWSTFNNKQDGLVSGTNIKTINGSSILGSGNLVVSGGGSGQLTLTFNTASTIWTNMPAAVTLLFGNAAVIQKADLTNYTQCRLLLNKLGVAGNTNSKIVLEYATSYTQTAATYIDIGTTEVSCATTGTNTFVDSGWINLATGAQGDVFIAVTGINGNGTLDPVLGSIVAQFK